jgi:hypothetical protein
LRSSIERGGGASVNVMVWGSCSGALTRN